MAKGYIYKITNTVNGKVYIGQTINTLKHRFYQHANYLRQNEHPNPHLQSAWNCYGESAFVFELIAECDPTQLDRLEREYIAQLNSYRNGYNRTEGGKQGSRDGEPCTWNGITYHSKGAAARALGITKGALQERLKRGHTCDADMPLHRGNPCIWNDVTYRNTKEAAYVLEVPISRFRSWVKAGFKSDADVQAYLITKAEKTVRIITPASVSPILIPCEWNGISYPSKRAAAKALGIASSTLDDRIKRGYTCDADMPGKNGTTSKAIIWNKHKYRSIHEAARAENLDSTNLSRWIKRGFTCDADVEALHPKRSIVWNKISYPTIKAAAQANSIHTSSMAERLARGYTSDDDMQKRPT